MSNRFSMKNMLPSLKGWLGYHAIPVSILFLVSIMYFLPQLQGKALRQGDIDHSYRVTKESWDYYKEEGKRNLWTNSMFSGMPTFQSGGLQNNNIFQYVAKATNFFVKKPLGLFLFGALGMYILLCVIGVNKWLSAIGALGFCYSTQMMLLVMAGHNSKLGAIMTFPLLLASLILLFRKNYYSGAFLLIISLGVNVFRNHFQMSWYLALILGLFVILNLVQEIKNKDWGHITKIVGIGIVAALIAIGTSATKIITTVDYLPESLRGEQIVSYDGSSESPSEGGGVTWTYANRFSYNYKDLLALIVPRFAGGSDKEKIDKNSAIAKSIIQSDYQPKRDRIFLYHGKQPFTEGPHYIGVVLFVFFLFSLLFVAKKWAAWAIALVVFAFMYSLGDSFELVNKLFFEYFPLFDKLRSPPSIITAIGAIFPLLACMGVHRMINSDKKLLDKKAKYIYWIGGSLSLLFIFLAFVGPSIIDVSHVNDQKYLSKGVSKDILENHRYAVMRASCLRSFALVVLSTLVFYLFKRGTLKPIVLIGAFGAFALFDLFSIDSQYLMHSNFMAKSSQVGKFQASDADVEILKDQDPHYRVLDETTSAFRNSNASYFHKSVGGYNAAKLRRYHDLVLFHLRKNNAAVYSMLNTKYFIRNQGGKKVAVRNPTALGNAWFVNSIKWASDDRSELLGLNSINPSSEVLIHENFKPYLGGLRPFKNGSVGLEYYSPDVMRYSYNSPVENLIVFSEIWYGPDKGWTAYIDGIPAEHIRVNYALRALRVPAGAHAIEFKFNPRSFRQGEMISKVVSLVSIPVILFLLYMTLRNIPEWKGNTSTITSNSRSNSTKKKRNVKSDKRKGRSKKKD